ILSLNVVYKDNNYSVWMHEIDDDKIGKVIFSYGNVGLFSSIMIPFKDENTHFIDFNNDFTVITNYEDHYFCMNRREVETYFNKFSEKINDINKSDINYFDMNIDSFQQVSLENDRLELIFTIRNMEHIFRCDIKLEERAIPVILSVGKKVPGKTKFIQPILEYEMHQRLLKYG
ncbi:hypothetical protein ACFL1H_08140, partial [Nanoarchaeota archaeon]